MKAMGGGDLILQQRYSFFPVASAYVALKELLLLQDYIKYVDVDESGAFGGTDLNHWWLDDFRKGKLKPDGTWNLATLVARKFGLSDSIVDEAWLYAEPKPVAKFVICRNTQETCESPMMPWHEIAAAVRGEAVFLGYRSEHAEFVRQYGYVDYYPIASLLEAAKIIQGARACFLNQSVFHAITEAMKKPLLLEVSHVYPSVIFRRSQAFYAWTEAPEDWRGLLANGRRPHDCIPAMD